LASDPASAEVLPDRPCPVADGGLQDRREGVGVGGVDLAAEGDPMPAETAVLGWPADRVGGHLRPADQTELEGRLRELRLGPDPADTAARVAAWLRSTPQAEAPA
jgi:hypothetical protein